MRLLFLFLFVSNFAFAQQNKQQIAYQYYINGEYSKAVDLYETLLDKNFSVIYYIPYYTSLIKLEQYKKAEFIARKFKKKYPKELRYSFAILIAKEKYGKTKNIEIAYSNLFKKLDGRRSQAITLANLFERHELYSRALNVYIVSEKNNPQNNYALQKAQIYAKLDDVELMLNEYLTAITKNPNQKNMILSKIQIFLNNDGIQSDINYNLLKKLLLIKIRKDPDSVEFSEILIWFFMQNQQFEMAFLQAKALDKRMNFNGEEVYNLAEVFFNNKKFKLAKKAYEYVISKGKKNIFYIDANIQKLNSLTQIITSENRELDILDLEYSEIINDLGLSKHTISLLTSYAHFKAFYQNDLITADSILNLTMGIFPHDVYEMAKCKMEYGDVLLMQGKVWESMLYFSQIEKEFKEHPLGHEAKLRVAKISYYNGDFEWAQAQLATLKASTSKLIANDAMDLSLLITDNYNLDTTEISMRTFAKADLLNYQKKYNSAILKYDSVLFLFPGHSLSDEILMRKADIFLNLGLIDDALDCFKKIEDDWSYDILADDALYKRAFIYDYNLKNYSKAMQLYERLISNHSSSIYVAEARKRYRKIRGDKFILEQ